MRQIDELFMALAKSKFRSRFKLRAKELNYLNEKGVDVIRSHAFDFIRQRLAPANPANDGKQTPMKNHPVFIAQHATGTCCRGCLEKWHKIQKGNALTDKEIEYIVTVICKWLDKQTQKS